MTDSDKNASEAIIKTGFRKNGRGKSLEILKSSAALTAEEVQGLQEVATGEREFLLLKPGKSFEVSKASK